MITWDFSGVMRASVQSWSHQLTRYPGLGLSVIVQLLVLNQYERVTDRYTRRLYRAL